MSPSLEYLERCAAESRYRVGALEKVARLGELAADIARHPFLGPALVLKGGTALNLCFGAPTRLSVDLGFNYVGQPGRERMLAERPRVEAAVEELARRRSYTVQRSADAFAGRNNAYIQQVDQALTDWAVATGNGAVIDRLRLEVVQQCDRFKDAMDTTQYERCMAFLGSPISSSG